MSHTPVVLGRRYRDKVTGFEGVATSRTKFLYACFRVCLERLENGEIKQHVVDEPGLEPVDDEVVVEPAPPERRTGGTRPTPTRLAPVTDWLNQLPPDERAQWDEFVDHFRRDTLAKMAGSAFVMSFAPGGDFDVKFAVELGAAIMLDKSLLAIVMPGTRVPAKLRAVADQIVAADIDTEAGQQQIRAAVEAMLTPDPQPAAEHCPTCGQAVEVVTADEGTSYFRGAEADRLRRIVNSMPASYIAAWSDESEAALRDYVASTPEVGGERG